jgi:ribokinase
MAVAVVGSINQDLVVTVKRFPEPGETLLGRGHFMAAGGKGANQAVAAARLGQEVTMVGRVGDDAFGHSLRHRLDSEGVGVDHVRIDLERGTGLAVITLDDRAENTIVVSAGANGAVTLDDVAAAESDLVAAEVTLLQLEVPLAAVDAAAELAGGLVVLNPAPAASLPAETLDMVDVLVPNRSELGLLAGVDEPWSLDDVEAAAVALAGPGTVVVTLGAEGALLVSGGPAQLVPAPQVEAVDTVGAGDAFCGALADALARGWTLPRAVEWAVHAGAIATTREGAQTALPTRAQVEESIAASPEGG